MNQDLITEIINECWPEDGKDTLAGVEDVKLFYNRCYDSSFQRLHNLVDSFHPGSCIVVAYAQLEYWTAIFYEITPGPTSIAGQCRYGWRYVVERSLDNLKNGTVSDTTEINQQKIEEIFTLIVIGLQCAELSNYLHYLPLTFQSVSIDKMPTALSGFPRLNDKESRTWSVQREYIGKRRDLAQFEGRFSPSVNPDFQKDLNTFLSDFCNFNLEVVGSVIQHIGAISSFYNASIIVQPFEQFVDLLLKMTKLPRQVVESIIMFSFISTRNPFHQSREVLKRSQSIRLLNFPGIIVELDKNLHSIYGSDADKPYITGTKVHVIVSPLLLSDWLNLFPYRMAFGQRSDLKGINDNFKKALSVLENRFKQDIFEFQVAEIYRQHGYVCIKLKKVNGKEIPCGEIDIIAFNPSTSSLVVTECKIHAPILDAKYMRQVILDHFEQKNYHAKFLKKINWVSQNAIIIKDQFKQHHGVVIPEVYSLTAQFITWSPSIIKFMVKEYEVLTYDELDKLLKQV
ncbi:MAG TPA: hypothetical protein PK325_00915 [Cyclobacteriaceae bacterium]|nr:hypothetical protein [Cyclobacteriaceae bacterium]HMV08170.1 hypothetical protein [Cyclobacteriaceae bacterium]HMX00811.1 hypothetical protein [Cyclobacteriaceae bacterium]HMX49314.1 hypothetical protein [Cyclobacteriaceae bacterium]HMY93614.1 hypothetical protein [Cyclobacteriaceae bacterium]